MRKGLTLLAAATVATLGLSSAASAQGWDHDRGHDHWRGDHDNGWHRGWRDHDRDEWRHRHHRRYRHYGYYNSGYYAPAYYNGYYGSGYYNGYGW